jgi:cell shape-determining protein MreC
MTGTSYLRFQHVFYALMGLSAIVAFLVPSRTADHYQPRGEILFSPIARPVGSIARAITRRTGTASAATNDHRPDMEIRSENESLRGEVMRLNARVAELTRQQNELGKLSGNLKELCQVTKVIGADSGNRDSISISATSLDGIRDEMYVVVTDALVGQIARVGALGSQVRLITDPAFRVRVRFVRFEKEFAEQLPIGSVVVQGVGGGQMSARLKLADMGVDMNLKPLDPIAGPTVREGDYIQIDDNECPAAIQGLKVGKVLRVIQPRDARLFADIQIVPTMNLPRLSEVMVMTRER